ncbi:serine/threonine-protein kinase pakG [Drosophila innubila]|uniref:serine/threonine-protein kinase pakG n=1 Tax=Drosophila innubila TaxID=198719 RepID=UPI00148DA3C5|nr:serine/threonine-protein kinase pakG [Drosophila innubila]XP_034483330.1 serine/threonine-protein kinase pakG [Drosophila innubila]XP_034483331.1 serine/threonine-protein kinase pakG [Drosophila innubila]
MESQRSVNNSSHNNNNNGNHRRGARPSVGYLLFQYQSELTRRHAEPTRLSRTKIHIIDGLVSRTIRHLKHCSVEELQACKRELVYKEQLRDELRSLRRRKNVSSSSSSSSSTNSNASSTSAATTGTSIKAPNTPPKPRASKQTTVTIYGPEIFV